MHNKLVVIKNKWVLAQEKGFLYNFRKYLPLTTALSMSKLRLLIKSQ